MNSSASVPRFSPTRTVVAPRKSILFCPDCGRTAPVDDWPVDAAADVETVVCPDCRAPLAVVRIGRTPDRTELVDPAEPTDLIMQMT